jgi:myo-inositol-hexaphosphate 3-phosphohydrolase
MCAVRGKTFLIMDNDDTTVVAETQATKRMDFIEAKMMDLHLRYDIPCRNSTSDPNKDFQQHVHLLIALTMSFDKSQLRVYDNQNMRVKIFKEKKWTNKDYFEDHFTLHDNSSQRKTIIVHRVRSKKSISTMKNNPSVIQHLKSTNSYLRAHFWKDDKVLL